MDKGMTTKIIAVVVVIIIVAAAAVVLLNNDKGSDNVTPGTVETAAIYGNVNSDNYLNQTDLDIIQDVIDGNKTLADWPLADANLDGTVDSADLEVVRKAINKESTTLYVVSYSDESTAGEVIGVSFPVTNYAMLSQANFRSVIATLGLADGMLASGTNRTLDATLDKKLYDGLQDGSITKLSGSSLTEADVETLTDLKANLVISEESGMSSEDALIKLLTEGGVTYLELNFKNTTWTAKSITALGILFQCEDKAKEYNDWCDSIMNTITSNEGSQFGTATVLTVTMINSVSGTLSDYYAASNDVGGKNIADWTDKTRNFATGDTWLLDSKYNADYIFHFRSTTFETGITDSAAATYSAYFADTYTYKNDGYYLINGVLPLIIRNAVMAETMYSDCFETGWSTELFEYYFTHFLGQDIDLSQYTYIYHATATA